jgi:hypothetical protein
MTRRFFTFILLNTLHAVKSCIITLTLTDIIELQLVNCQLFIALATKYQIYMNTRPVITEDERLFQLSRLLVSNESGF